MLKVDLDHPNYWVENVIRRTCAAFGTVRSVKVHRAAKPFALIEMDTSAQTASLAAAFGGSTLGSHALVPLARGHFNPLGMLTEAA